MDRYDNLASRYRPSWAADNSLNRLTGSLNGTISVVRILNAKAEKMRETGHLTAAGLGAELRAFSRKEVMPTVAKSRAEVERMRGELAERRRSLTVPKPDPTDVAGAVLRMEIRNWLRERSQAELSGILLDDNVDPAILSAAFEVPAAMIGVTKEFRAEMEGRVLVQQHGPAMERIEELEEAVAVVEATLDLATGDLFKECGFEREPDYVFRDWMKDSAAEAGVRLAA